MAAPPQSDTQASTHVNAQSWRSHLRGLREIAGTPGARYLESRGISPDLAHAAGARFSPSWYGRPAVVFPVRNRAGALVAAQGRYTDGRTNPKTRTAGPKSQGVFATPGAWDAAQIVITEAPIDALSLAACGLPAIALCGKTGPEWLPLACGLRHVFIAFDHDRAGEEAAAKLSAPLLLLGASVERLRPAAGKDWNEILVTHGAGALGETLASALGADALHGALIGADELQSGSTPSCNALSGSTPNPADNEVPSNQQEAPPGPLQAPERATFTAVNLPAPNGSSHFNAYGPAALSLAQRVERAQLMSTLQERFPGLVEAARLGHLPAGPATLDAGNVVTDPARCVLTTYYELAQVQARKPSPAWLGGFPDTWRNIVAARVQALFALEEWCLAQVWGD